MIAGLTIAALVGTWTCTTPSEPLSHFRETFAADGKGYFSAFYPHGGESHSTFMYTIESRQTRYGGYIISRGTNTLPTRIEMRLRNDRLDLTAQQFFRNKTDGWTTLPDQETYHCVRSK